MLEIRKILNQVPPVVIPRDESKRKIYEIEHDQNVMPKPDVLKLKEIESIQKLKKDPNFSNKNTNGLN